MTKTRSWMGALVLLLALAQGCDWFDTRMNPNMDKQSEANGGTGSEPLSDGGIPREPGSTAGTGGSGGTSAGTGGGGTSAGTGGSGGGEGPAGGKAGGGEPGDGGPEAGCEPSCFEPPESFLAPGHPEPRRFALTDESTLAADQPRLWLLVPDDDGSRRLLSVRPALNEHGTDEWLDTGIDDVTSNPEGASFAEAGVQQQRVFFIRHGAVQMLTPNDRESGSEDAGAAEPFLIDELATTTDDVAFDRGDLGVVTFMRQGVRRIAVLVPAAIEGRAGGYCVLEVVGNEASSQCSTATMMHGDTDVVGVVVGAEVHFYFRTIENGLYRVTRTPGGAYEGAAVATPGPLAPSLVAIPSEIAAHIELLAITNDGELWAARPLATDRAELSWTPLAPIGTGVKASTSPAALAAVVLHEDNRYPGEERTYTTTELRVIGSDGQLHQNTTDDEDDARPWLTDWYHVDAIERDQRVLAVGAIANIPLEFFGSFEFGSAWSVIGTERATTLQNAQTVFAIIRWHDHVRMTRRAHLPATTALAELSSAVGGDGAIVAATARGPVPPFGVTLFGSSDGATTFQSETLSSHLAAPAGPISLLQPTVRYLRGTYHLAALERALPDDCVERSGELRRITYRRAADAAGLAAAQPPNDYFIVRSGTDYADNVTLAVTDGTYGTTAHLVYNVDNPGGLAYWRLRARTAKEPPELLFGGALDLHDMPDGPPVLATGLAEAVYVATADANRFEVCWLPPDGAVTDASCSDLTSIARLDARELYFGAPRDEPYGACAGDAAPHYACLRDERPFSITLDTSKYTDPALPPKTLPPSATRDHRVVVAYQGVGPSAGATASTSIWLTVSPGGALGGWTTPVEISARSPDDTRHYFDPEVTIDESHRVTVTYSAIERSPEQGQRVHTYVVQGELDWYGNLVPLEYWPDWTPKRFVDQAAVGSWSPESLPFDCVSGRAALGAYREPDAIDGRAMHTLRDAEGHDALWLNRYARQ